MESLTHLKNLRISPKKLRFLLPEIKKLDPQSALDYLTYTPKKAARFFYKSIKSAINNAKQTLKVDENLLKFQTLLVEEGQKLKRFKAGGRGGVKPIKRRFSHIKIVLVAKSKKKIEKKIENEVVTQNQGQKLKVQVKSKN